MRTLLTENAHQLIVEKVKSGKNVINSFKALRKDMITGGWIIEPQAKSNSCKEMFIKARIRHFAKERMKHRVGHFVIPQMSEDQVRSFIRGGVDPLDEHIKKLVEESEKQPDTVSHKKNVTIGNMMRNVNKAQGPKTFMKPFLLIQSLTVEDVIDTVIDIVCKSMTIVNKRYADQQLLQQQLLLTNKNSRKHSVAQRRSSSMNAIQIAIPSNDTTSNIKMTETTPNIQMQIQMMLPQPPAGRKPSHASSSSSFANPSGGRKLSMIKITENEEEED